MTIYQQHDAENNFHAAAAQLRDHLRRIDHQFMTAVSTLFPELEKLDELQGRVQEAFAARCALRGVDHSSPSPREAAELAMALKVPEIPPARRARLEGLALSLARYPYREPHPEESPVRRIR